MRIIKEKTAAAQYEARRQEALKLAQMLLAEASKPAPANVNWGHCGGLRDATDHLYDAARTLGLLDESETV